MSKNKKKNEPSFFDQIRFSRRLSLWQATARSLGVIAATIVFVLLGEAVDVAGPLVPLAAFLTALLVGLNCLGYAELAVSVARPGGAYTLVHEGSGGSGGIAFITGWPLVLSGLGLCGLLAQGAARYFSFLLHDLLGLALPAGELAMALVLLVVLESILLGRRQRRLPFALPMIILLLILALLALTHPELRDYSATYGQPGPAVTLLTVAFVGIEMTTSHQREIRRRGVNLPRALLIALTLATGLGVGLTAIAGPRLAAGDVPLASLGEAVGGDIGRLVVLALGSAVLILSLGRAMAVVIRQFYVMSEDGFWPAWLRHVQPRWGVPARLALLVALLTVGAAWIPGPPLARTSGLLYLVTLMSVNLTLARRQRRETRSFFSLPFHPWVPALTLAVDLLVLPLWGLVPLAWAGGCLLLGGLIYLAYGRSRHIEAQEGVTIFRPPAEERTPTAFRVLVPIANPATAGTLLGVAERLAQSQGGSVLALQVVVVPEPMPLEVGRWRAQTGRAPLEQALALATTENQPIETMTRVARSVAQGILDTATEEKVDLIVLGWQGPSSSRGVSLGRIVDDVLRDAPCNVMVIRGERPVEPGKILVPTAGGPHARAATWLATRLAKSFDAEITLLSIQVQQAAREQVEATQDRIAETLEELALDVTPQQKVVQAASVVEGIVREAREHDLVLLGVSDENVVDRLVFGSIPLQVARRVPATALVQAYRGLTGRWTRRLVHTLRSTVPPLSQEAQLEMKQTLARGARPGINYFVLIVLSSIIAALGLLLDSPAVVIGAMLVAPLMSPILGLSLGLVLGDLRLIRFSTEAISKGVALALIITVFIGLVSPLKSVTGEILARARPTLLDMAVALASGMAGAYAMARKDVSAALPGVAIAAALMPPLATVGLALALGNLQVALGAFLLFVTNIAAMSLVGGIVFLLLGIRPHVWGPESRRQLRRRMAASLVMLLVIAIPLGVILGNIIEDAAQEQAVREILTEQLAIGDGRLEELEVDRTGESLTVVATVRSVHTFDQETVDVLAETLNRQLGNPVRLEIVVLPTVRSTPLPSP